MKYIFLILLFIAVKSVDKADEDYYYDEDEQNENTTDGSEDVKSVVSATVNTTQITSNVNQILPVIIFNQGSFSCSTY